MTQMSILNQENVLDNFLYDYNLIIGGIEMKYWADIDSRSKYDFTEMCFRSGRLYAVVLGEGICVDSNDVAQPLVNCRCSFRATPAPVRKNGHGQEKWLIRGCSAVTPNNTFYDVHF